MPIRYSNSTILYLFFAFGVSFCVSCGSYQSSIFSEKERSSLRSDIIASARNQIGDRYEYAAKGPSAFDCSGLVAYVYGENGISVSGSASSILNQGKEISRQEARTGDLVFYRKNGKVFHVSIIVSNRNESLRVVHSTTSRGVIEENIMSSTYWRPMIHKIISLESIKK